MYTYTCLYVLLRSGPGGSRRESSPGSSPGSRRPRSPSLRASGAISLLLLLLVSLPVVTCAFLTLVQCVFQNKNTPRSHEVPVCWEYVLCLGKAPLFKTCFPCRRTTHLYMSLFATCSNFCCDLLVIITSC